MFDKFRKTVGDIKAKPLDVRLQSMPAVKSMYLRLTDTLQDKDKQKESLTRAYIGAFSIIAALSFVGHMLTVHIINNQLEDAKVTFTITNMRALVDTVISQASAFKASGDNFDDDLLSHSLEKLKAERANITNSSSDAIIGMFNTPPFSIGDKVNKFVEKTEELMRNRRTNQNEAVGRNFTELTGEISKVLEINLDLALSQYRESVVRQIDISKHLQDLAVLIILLVLILEAAFIFRPLAKQLGEYHQHLIHLAYTDTLTGLNNRRAFIQLAAQGLDYYNRHKTPFALVLMDLDHFKSVNDTYGHKVGDLVLQHYSALMQKHLRAHDTLGRIGGEEFAIFLPQTTGDEAMPLVERFRKIVAETPCSYMDGNNSKKQLSYSSSFGIIAISGGNWTLDELLIKADQNLYKAKEQGRNRVVMEQV